MLILQQTDTYRRWIGQLKDERVDAIINARVTRLSFGLFGDAKSVGSGVVEARIHYGPGYRIYFQRRGATILLLLCGGDKGSQETDIATAKRLAAEWNDSDA
jgi:putative addiction module killer protein